MAIDTTNETEYEQVNLKDIDLTQFPAACGTAVDLTLLDGPPDDGFRQFIDNVLTMSEVGAGHTALARWVENSRGIQVPALLDLMHGGTDEEPHLEKCMSFEGEELDTGQWHLKQRAVS